ncbi:universal stress protein [Salipiger pallidus]|uniref:Universal stress protein n=1 Tax=Salipiger pallidus TaxID=1775170 RepID=A0A8J2ZMC5_9RHOB|nr:universal stress protein [Salipiger pallidus]GGG80585.1 universal stress protein [Salipiger pallidus]
MYRNILVPVAFDNEDKAKAAIAVAQGLAAQDAAITLLHVVEQIPGYVMAYVPPDHVAEQRKTMQADLDALAAGVPGARAVLVDGHSGRTILDYAEAKGSDLIVIASHRPGMADMLIGSTAAQVVRHATCAVHVLR